MIKIDKNNYELWLLRYAEGELTAAERETVEVWLAEHPEAAEELALYNESPRIERDKNIRYTGTVHHTVQLWPVVLRWSAAAAIVVALMVPALRINTLDTPTCPSPIIAEARNVEQADTTEMIEENQIMTPKSHKKVEPSTNCIAAIPVANPIPTNDSIKSTPVEIIETTTLIAFENAPEETETIASESLIVFDRSADWGDILLAANDAYRESLSERPLGRMVSRALPDSRQLEENVVEPLREKINNIKSVIK